MLYPEPSVLIENTVHVARTATKVSRPIEDRANLRQAGKWFAAVTRLC